MEVDKNNGEGKGDNEKGEEEQKREIGEGGETGIEERV